jgi:hypothetical protein
MPKKLDAIKKRVDEAEAKRQQKAKDKLLRDEKNHRYEQGIEAKKLKRERKKKVKEFAAAKQDIPPELLVPIPDPEKIWLAEQEEMATQLQLQRQEQEQEEVAFVTNTISDQSLQQDYMAFPEAESAINGDTSTSRSGLEGLELYDSNKDYS